MTLLRSFDTDAWHDNPTAYLAEGQTLAARYAHERKQNLIPVQIAPGKEIIIQHTVRYTATNPARFEKLWR